jgi:hypothetical protein
VVLTATDNRTPSDVAGALDAITASGRAPALVLARSSTWVPDAGPNEGGVIAAARNRCPVRLLTGQQDIAESLR